MIGKMILLLSMIVGKLMFFMDDEVQNIQDLLNLSLEMATALN